MTMKKAKPSRRPGKDGAKETEKPPTPEGRGNSGSSNQSAASEASPQLCISRNKHWRYISLFQGPWIHMPLHVLEAIAHINYNMPRPRAIDAALLFDMVKIRKAVDEATDLAVRAASDTVSATLSPVHSGRTESLVDRLSGARPIRSKKLSAERRSRMHELACTKLARAYRLDEIASSVAVMQGSSVLDGIAHMVLQRNPDLEDAKYVHFFHEKIPSRRLAESTSLQPLRDMMCVKSDAEVLRTLATVKLLKDDYEGAIQDLTQAINIAGRRRRDVHDAASSAPSSHTPSTNASDTNASGTNASGTNTPSTSSNAPSNVPSSDAGDAPGDASREPAAPPRPKQRRHEVILQDHQQPTGIDSQLLFLRGWAYLSLASQCVPRGISCPPAPLFNADNVDASDGGAQAHAGDKNKEDQGDDGQAAGDARTASDNKEDEQAAHKSQIDARRFVKTAAKKALKDLLAFLSVLEFSPGVSGRTARQFQERIFLASEGVRNRRHQDSDDCVEPPRVFPLNQLFSADCPVDLAPYPRKVEASQPQGDAAEADEAQATAAKQDMCEWVTCHPLLVEALHCMLLAHCLAQTPAKELREHAYMVARVVRLCDGYPIFHTSRSSARSDWVEVLRRTDNWVELTETWSRLCCACIWPSESAPTMRTHNALDTNRNFKRMEAASVFRRVMQSGVTRGMSLVARDVALDQMIMTGHRPCDEVMDLMLQESGEHGNTETVDTGDDSTVAATSVLPAWWTRGDGKEPPASADRAMCIAKWVLAAPQVKAGPKRRRRANRGATSSKTDDDAARAMAGPGQGSA